MTPIKPRLIRKSVTDTEILDWIEKYRPRIYVVRKLAGDEIEIDLKDGCWRRKTLRSAVRAAMSGVRV